MSSPSMEDIKQYLNHPTYPGQFDVSLKDGKGAVLAYPFATLKKFYVNGEPLQCTIECDYCTINVSGSNHQLLIIGIKNQVNLIGSGHVIYFEGFTNQVNYCTDVKDGQISVNGCSNFSFEVGVSNGKISSGNNEPKPPHFEFPESLKNMQRRRISWKRAVPLEKANEDNMEV